MALMPSPRDFCRSSLSLLGSDLGRQPGLLRLIGSDLGLDGIYLGLEFTDGILIAICLVLQAIPG